MPIYKGVSRYAYMVTLATIYTYMATIATSFYLFIYLFM